MSCHYTGCSLYKHGLLSFKWDEMGGLFTVCWYCYFNLQLQLGPFRPRKIGSTLKLTSESYQTNTHTLFLSLTYTQIRFVAFPNSELHSLPHLEEQNLTSWPFLWGSAFCCWKDQFSDRGEIVSLTDTIASLSGLFTIIFWCFTSLKKSKTSKLMVFLESDHRILHKSKNKIDLRLIWPGLSIRFVIYDLSRSDQMLYMCVFACINIHTLYMHMHAPSLFSSDSQHLKHKNVKHHCCATPGLLCNISPV